MKPRYGGVVMAFRSRILLAVRSALLDYANVVDQASGSKFVERPVGASPRVVMEILGHSGIAITVNPYAHVLPSLLGGAAEGMDDVLG